MALGAQISSCWVASVGCSTAASGKKWFGDTDAAEKAKGSKQLIFQSPPNRHRTATISGHANVAAGCRSEVKGFVQRYEPLSLPIPPVLN